MSETFTTTTIASNVGGDAELTATTSGTSLLKWGMPVTSGRSGDEDTQWVTCVMFGKRAESLKPYILKGKFFVVSGRMTMRKYKNKDGTPGASLEMNVQEIGFGPKVGESPAGNDRPADKGFGNDDVPF